MNEHIEVSEKIVIELQARVAHQENLLNKCVNLQTFNDLREQVKDLEKDLRKERQCFDMVKSQLSAKDKMLLLRTKELNDNKKEVVELFSQLQTLKEKCKEDEIYQVINKYINTTKIKGVVIKDVIAKAISTYLIGEK